MNTNEKNSIDFREAHDLPAKVGLLEVAKSEK